MSEQLTDNEIQRLANLARIYDNNGQHQKRDQIYCALEQLGIVVSWQEHNIRIDYRAVFEPALRKLSDLSHCPVPFLSEGFEEEGE